MHNDNNMKKLLGLYFFLFIVVLVASCSSGSSAISTSTSSPGATLSLTGDVSAPQTASGSLNYLTNGGSLSVEDAPAASVSCTIYTTEGESLGEITTDADGVFTADVELEDLKGADDTGTSWTEEVAVVCDGVGVQKIEEISYTEGETTTASMGTVDTETTLAAVMTLKDIQGFAWGQDFSGGISGIDLACQAKLNEGLFKYSDADDDTMGGQFGVVKEMMKGIMAGGIDPSTVNSDYDMFDLMGEMMDGGITGESWDNLVDTAGAVNTDFSGDKAKTMVANGDYTNFAAMKGVMDMATSSAGVSTTASGSNLKTLYAETESSNNDLCGVLKGQNSDVDATEVENMLKATAGIFMSAGNATDLEATFGDSEGLGIIGIFGFVGTLQAGGKFTGDNFGEMDGKFEAYYGYFKGADKGTIYDSSTGQFDPYAFEVIYEVGKNCSGTDSATLMNCGTAMQSTIQTQGGYEYFYSDGAVNTTEIGNWAGYLDEQIAGGFDPTNVGDDYWKDMILQNGETFNSTPVDNFTEYKTFEQFAEYTGETGVEVFNTADQDFYFGDTGGVEGYAGYGTYTDTYSAYPYSGGDTTTGETTTGTTTGTYTGGTTTGTYTGGTTTGTYTGGTYTNTGTYGGTTTYPSY